jgi:hypothetical protein
MREWAEHDSVFAFSGGYPETAVSSGGAYGRRAARVFAWYVKGFPLSQRTNAPTYFGGSHSIDVMTDLVSVYSGATVDSTSATRVKAATVSARCFGVVQPWSERSNNSAVYQPPLSLRQALTSLAQSADIDIFINWDGNVAFSSDIWDFTTAIGTPSLVEFTEASPSGVQRWVASDGERGAPYNRVFFNGGRTNPAEGLGSGRGGYEVGAIPFQGPFDLDGATIPLSARTVEVGLEQGWRPWRQQNENPWQWRQLDIVARDRVSFRTSRAGLMLELGDYFKLTWTRGPSINGPYASAVFQCDGITYAPGDDSVEIEAIWRDDIQTERQYLLDDEALLVRSKGAMSSVVETFGDEFALFTDSVNLSTMGVLAGDILVLRDSSQAADVFTLNAAFRVVLVVDDQTLSVVDASGAPAVLPTATIIINADWSIVRGATTYPTVVSDPTNYPSGGSMYGKVTAAAGTTSDTTTGNRLING